MPSLDDYARAGIEAINEKKFDVAIESFTKALDLDPTRPDMNNALGMAHMHRGEAGAAIPYLERAVELAEPYASEEHQAMKRHFHSGLATAYQLMDRVPDAAATLRGMIERWPDEAEPRLQLGALCLGACLLDEGVRCYEDCLPLLDAEHEESATALIGAIKAFQQSEHTGEIFLLGHCQSYRDYFDGVAEEQVQKGWYAEAARMAKTPSGEPAPFVPEGARPYAFMRVDLVDPQTGEVSSVYSEQEPMIVALNGLEPLAQVAMQFPWPGYPFEVLVSTQCPWHWLSITVQFQQALEADNRVETVDTTIGEWYLKGYNGDFGDANQGRFHYITDPELLATDAVTYTVDLGRASFDAAKDLLNRLTVLHAHRPIRRVVFGQARLPQHAEPHSK